MRGVLLESGSSTGPSTQRDPIGLAGGINQYGYAGGDPVNFSDPFGLCASADSVKVSVTNICGGTSTIWVHAASAAQVDAVLATSKRLTKGTDYFSPSLIHGAFIGHQKSGGGFYILPASVKEGGITFSDNGTRRVAFRKDVYGALVDGEPARDIGDAGITAAGVVGHEGVHLVGERDEQVAKSIKWGVKQ